MIVTCPACTSRYKFDDARLDGRSAKITCPTCEHVFVVDPPRIDPVTLKDTWPSAAGSEAAPAVVLPEQLETNMSIREFDFAERGVTLRVKQGLVTREYHTFAEIQEALEEGAVDPSDALSVDGRHYEPIGSETALLQRLEDLKRRLDAGDTVEQSEVQSFIIGDDDGDEDAPTMIVRTGNLNLDEVMSETDDDPPPPPPATPAFHTEEDPVTSGDDPVTETATMAAQSSQATSATSPSTSPASTARTQGEARSIVPIVLLVLVVIAVIVLIGYTQGLIPGVGA